MSDSSTTSARTAIEPSQPNAQTLKSLHDHVATLTERVEELETELTEKDERINELEQEVDRQDSLLDALRRKTGATREMVTELQSRELEKNAHLQWENVDPNVETLEVDTVASRSSPSTTATHTLAFPAVKTHSIAVVNPR